MPGEEVPEPEEVSVGDIFGTEEASETLSGSEVHYDESASDDGSSDDASSEDSSSDETSDDAVEAEETPMEADNEEEKSEGDEWSEFNDYKISNDDGSEEYDFTNETNPDTLVKVFKLMKNDDKVSVVNNDGKVFVKDNEAGTEYVIDFDCDSSCENNDEINFEITMDESVGYTDNYQDKDPIEGLTMDNAPKNTKDWHKGVPTGTSKPWAGKGDSQPYGKKTEKVFEITLNDEIDTQDDEFIDENVTTSKYQQRRMVKTMVPDNAYVQDGAHEISQGGKLKTESLQRRINAALQENKQLKETVAKVSKIMKEAVQVNVNLGHIVRLMVENSTTKLEKEDIVKRFNSVKSNEEAKNLYESISSELKKSHSSIVTEQATTVEGSKKINESKIYEEPNGVIDMMKRMGMYK
jgi:hypothetical protein